MAIPASASRARPVRGRLDGQVGEIARRKRAGASLCLCLLALALLAGCVEVPADAEDDDDFEDLGAGPRLADGSLAPLSDALSDCYEHVGSFAVPADAYAAMLPPGFSLRGYSAVGTLPDDESGLTAELSAVASHCQDGDGAVVARLVLFLMVEPPSAWYDPRAEFGHLLLLAYFTDSSSHADLMRAWGFDPVLFVGPIELDEDATPVSSEARVAAEVGDAQAALATLVAGAPVEMEGSAARFFATDGSGSLVAVADASFGSFDALLGRASLTASSAAGVWATPAEEFGLGLHIWGHTNTWTHVPLDSDTED